jgi:hypothetical protein
MVRTKFAAKAQWLKEFVRPIGAWWAIMSGAVSIPFAFLALFNVFSAGFLFAALAYVSLWVLVVSLYRRTSGLIKFKLEVLPGYHIRPDDPDSVFVNLSLLNSSAPPAELNNIVGEYWTDQRFIRKTAREPNRCIRGKVGAAVFARYDFSVGMLHKSTSIQIAEWKFRAPTDGEFIPIGVRVVSSETPWQRNNWRVVRDGEKLRITPASQQSN